MIKQFFPILCLVAILQAASGANACVVMSAFDINNAQNADTIFIGKITNFQMAKSKINSLHNYGIFDVSVQQFLKGNSPKEISVIWSATTNTIPQDLSDELALIALDKTAKSDIIREGYQPSSQRDTRMVYFQSPCARAFVLRPSDENIGLVRAALEGRGRTTLSPDQLFHDQRAGSVTEPQKSHWGVISTVLAALSLLGGTAILWLLLRRNSKKS
jgi:hypothetical protein